MKPVSQTQSAPNSGAEDASHPTAPPSKRKSRPYAIFAVVLAIVLVGYFVFRLVTGGKENTDDAQVATDMVPIATRVSGTVLSVPVTDHQAVKKGDVLAQIDPADYETRVRQAAAELNAAKAQRAAAEAQLHVVAATAKGGLGAARAALSGTTASAAGAEAQIAAAKASVLRAQADAEKAENDLRRGEMLRKDDAIPQAQVDSLRSAAAAARAGLAQANANLAAAQEAKQTARTRIAEAQGRVEQSAPIDAQLAAARANFELADARVAGADAALARAQLDLSYTKITAPEDGHISTLAVRVGQLVSQSQMITNVLPHRTYVIANFKETQVGAMRPGQPAVIEIDALPGRSFHARVDSLAFGTGAQFSLLPPDNASGNFVKVVQRVPVKLTWTEDPKDAVLQAGLSANVTVNVK
jgi:membrane fusion protein (multidrug efflux system)